VGVTTSILAVVGGFDLLWCGFRVYTKDIETRPAMPNPTAVMKNPAVQFCRRSAVVAEAMATGMETMMVVLVLHWKIKPKDSPAAMGQM
jgi:hypothetical protein